jgi:hypothetical protein
MQVTCNKQVVCKDFAAAYDELEFFTALARRCSCVPVIFKTYAGFYIQLWQLQNIQLLSYQWLIYLDRGRENRYETTD